MGISQKKLQMMQKEIIMKAATQAAQMLKETTGVDNSQNMPNMISKRKRCHQRLSLYTHFRIEPSGSLLTEQQWKKFHSFLKPFLLSINDPEKCTISMLMKYIDN